jgi:hypothetical protein
LGEFAAGLQAYRDGIDNDGDGLLDGVETNTGTLIDATDTGTDPLDPDWDSDGLFDGFEVAYHPDFDPFTMDDPDLDPDADGLTNLVEQQAGTHPVVADTDGDTLTDGFERFRVRTLPFLLRTVTTVPDAPNAVYAADVDGDGDADLLAASINDGSFTWFENIDGAGGFGPLQVVATVSGAKRIAAPAPKHDSAVPSGTASQGNRPLVPVGRPPERELPLRAVVANRAPRAHHGLQAGLFLDQRIDQHLRQNAHVFAEL